MSESRRERRDRARRVEEMERRLAELDRLDAHYGLGASPHLPPPPRRTRGRGRGGTRSRGLLPSLTVALMLVGIVVALHPGAGQLRALLGFAPEFGDARDPGIGGTHAFTMTQDDGSPVGYDPCSVIRLEINPDGAPDGHRAMVETAAERITEISGLQFEIVGETDERDPGSRTGGGRGPVPPALVSWLDADEEPRLAGDVAGIGGSSAVRLNGRWFLQTGIVILDRDYFASLEGSLGGGRTGQAIVDHEMGHLVGLDHVDDPSELMYEQNLGVATFGPGDREGLAALGSIPCA